MSITINWSGNLFLYKENSILMAQNDNNPPFQLSVPIIIFQNANNTEISNIILKSDLHLDYTNEQYIFIFNSDNISFDGNYFNIFVENASLYSGLFQDNIQSNLIIENIGVILISSQLNNNSGGLCRSNFGQGNNVLIQNCYTVIPIMETSSAGIIPTCSINMVIKNCYTYFNTMNFASGGIAFNNYGIILNCYSSGILSKSSGGIVRNNFNFIVNCYNTSITNGLDIGGIALNSSNTGIIQNCYVLGSDICIVNNGIVNQSYAENGIWSNINAETYLQTTNVYFITIENKPFLLQSFVGKNYDNVNLSNLIVNEDSSPANLPVNYYSFEILPTSNSQYNNFTVNGLNGVIKGDTLGENLKLYVSYFYNPNFGYVINNLNINVYDNNPPCFFPETKILLINEENNFYMKSVEKIIIGEFVFGFFSKKKTKIINVKKNICKFKNLNQNAPILIKKDEIKENVPNEDLFISGFHKIIFMKDENTFLKVASNCLFSFYKNFNDNDDITYYHLELEDRNECFFANNIAVESYTL